MLTLSRFICSDYSSVFHVYKLHPDITSMNLRANKSQKKDYLMNELRRLSNTCIDECRLKCIGLGTIDTAAANTSRGWKMFFFTEK